MCYALPKIVPIPVGAAGSERKRHTVQFSRLNCSVAGDAFVSQQGGYFFHTLQ